MNRKDKAIKLGLNEMRVHMGTFDYNIQFVVGDYRQAIKFTAWLHDISETELAEFDEVLNGGYAPRGKTFRRSGYLPVIWIPRKPRGSREVATLAHEILHAIFDLFEWASIPIDRSTEEVVCHAQAHVLTTFLEESKTWITPQSKHKL